MVNKEKNMIGFIIKKEKRHDAIAFLSPERSNTKKKDNFFINIKLPDFLKLKIIKPELITKRGFIELNSLK